MKQLAMALVIFFTPVFAMQKPGGITSLVNASNEFAFTLYEMSLFEEDFVYSPFAIYSSMIMAYLGAEKQTAKEIREVMDLRVRKDTIAKTYHNWSKGVFKKKQGCEFFIANGIWVEKTSPIRPDYANILFEEFQAKVQAVDFHNAPTMAKRKINLWIADKTEFRIENLLSESDVNVDTKIILANAVFFRGNWDISFNEALTMPSPFHNEEGEMYVEMMHQVGDFPFYETAAFKAVAIPFECPESVNRFSLIVLLPKDAFSETSLSIDTYLEILKRLKTKKVDLKLPKFSIHSNYNLNHFFQEIGMNIPFTRLANFSNINGRLDLYLSNILHGSFISIDEYGSSASAATASSINTQENQKFDVTFHAERPFYFFLSETNSRSLFFLGKCIEPKRAKS